MAGAEARAQLVLRVGPWLAGLALAVSGCHRATARGEEVAPDAAAEAHVETFVAAESEVPRYVFVTGSLAPGQTADVAAGTPGRVVRTYVERGTTVTAGALLAELDRRTSSATALETGAQARIAADAASYRQRRMPPHQEAHRQQRDFAGRSRSPGRAVRRRARRPGRSRCASTTRGCRSQ